MSLQFKSSTHNELNVVRLVNLSDYLAYDWTVKDE